MNELSNEGERIYSILANCKVFSGLSEEELRNLTSTCQYNIYQKNEKVLTVDHEGKYVFVVGKGRLSLKLKNGKRKEFEGGELFGEIAAISDKGRLGTITCEEDSEIVAINKYEFMEDNGLPLELRYNLLKALAKKMISYFYDNIPRPTIELLEKGECEYVEFKLSLSKPVIVPSVRAIAAFMNLNGGAILFGVRDDGRVEGIKNNKSEIDKFQRDIYSKIKMLLGGQHFATMVNFDQEKIGDKLLLRADVDSSPSPVFFREHKGKEEKELFIVRTGCLNTKIKRASEVIKYVQKNFKLNTL